MDKIIDKVVKGFWTKYIEADYFERKELIEEVITKNVLAVANIKHKEDELLNKYATTQMLKSYFDDLIEYLKNRGVDRK